MGGWFIGVLDCEILKNGRVQTKPAVAESGGSPAVRPIAAGNGSSQHRVQVGWAAAKSENVAMRSIRILPYSVLRDPRAGYRSNSLYALWHCSTERFRNRGLVFAWDTLVAHHL